MPIKTLEHVNIETTSLEATMRFYTEVLGLKAKERPAGRARPGAWVYDDQGVAVVHLSLIDAGDADLGGQSLANLQEPVMGAPRGTGTVNHLGFVADDYDGFRARLCDQQVRFTEREIPDSKLRQLFVKDPNGVLVEISFKA